MREKSLFLIFVLIVAFFLIPTSSTSTHGNSAQYLEQALQLLKKEPVSDYLHRPLGFPYLIFLTFKFFGVSIQAAYIMVRVFYSLSLVVVYLLAAELFSPLIGLISFLLVITASSLNHASIPLNLDPIVPFFILLSLLFFAKAIKKENTSFMGLSGFVLGIGYLIKEISLLYVLLPFCLFFFRKEISPRFILKSFILFFGSFLILFIPWVLYIAGKTGDIFAWLGGASPQVVGRYFQEGNSLALILSPDFFKNLFHYFQAYIVPNFDFFSYLFISSWIYLGFLAFSKKDRGAKIILIGLILFAPLLVYLGSKGDRLGHGITFYHVSFIGVAAFLVFFFNFVLNFLQKKIPFFRGKEKVFLSLLIIVFSGYGFFEGDFHKVFSRGKKPKFYNTYYLPTEFKVYGRHQTEYQEAADWVRQNIPPQSRVFMDGGIIDVFNFFTEFKYSFQPFSIDMRMYNVAENIIRKSGGIPVDDLAEGKILSLWPSRKFMDGRRGGKFKRYRVVEFLTENAMRKSVEKALGHYIIVSDRNTFMGHFLSLMGAEVHFKNVRTTVYYMDSKKYRENDILELATSDRFHRLFPWLEENFPAEYAHFIEFLASKGFSEAMILSYSYGKKQEKWFLEHIKSHGRIAYYSSEEGLITDNPKYQFQWYVKEKPLSYFKQNYDYLLFQNYPKLKTRFPSLSLELDSLVPMKEFMLITELGDGWRFYQLNKLQES